MHGGSGPAHADDGRPARARSFDRHPFVLIDVGCAGGIAEPWRAFRTSLVAHGYDQDVSACEEAQANEPFPHVRYHAQFVGLPESHPSVQRRRADAGRWPNTNIWGRVTAGYLAARQQDTHAGRPAVAARLADPSSIAGIEEIVYGEQLPTVDFLKVDVDGPDIEVLESAGGYWPTGRGARRRGRGELVRVRQPLGAHVP
jgi:hypothetical protein